MTMSIRNLNNRRLKKAVTKYHNHVIGTFRVGRYSTLGISAEKVGSEYRFDFKVEGDFADDYGEAKISREKVKNGEFVWMSEAGESYHVPNDIIRYFMDVVDTL